MAEKKIAIADKKVPYALKFLSGNNQRISEYSSVKREINMWIDASGNKNVVSVLDGFIHENYFVIVSEYANNGSLREWLKDNGGKSPNLEKTVEIMSGVLDGLSHLHARKIIHRDLKPENVLLKGDIPCIVDFGVSRMVETVSLTSSQLGTNSAGSPMYMSPESFERIKPSPQIDIWAAGVMLFEMLSGKTPYSGETIPALIFEIVTKEPRSLPATVPDTIQQVVKKALAKDISDRFSTAREMRDALMKALYLQDHTSTASDEDFISTRHQEKQKDANVLTSANTLSLDSIVSSSNAKGNKKSLIWVGVVATALIAASIGIFTMTNSTGSDNSNQNNTSISNQQMAIETNSNSNSNFSAENTGKIEVITKSGNTAKPSNQIVERKTPTKSEPAPKTDKLKTTPKPKKTVTLKDLIDEP
ncbi:MAG: serine/threonine protein kinase [Acidobacteria bacterium]|nr:serine/threonine protein kinase [Acidobacteriota bacterium]